MNSLHDISELAGKFIDMGKINDAIDCINDGLIFYPTSPELYDLRALARFQILEVDAAIDDLQQATRLDSTFHLSYSHLAELYNHKDDFITALQFAEKALSVEPENLYYKALIVFTLLKQQEYDKVIFQCNEILARQNNYYEMMEYRASAFAGKKEYLKAAIDLETAYVNGPGQPRLLNDIGYYYSKANKMEKAKDYLEQALRNNPMAPYPYHNLGYVFLMEKNYKKAHELINKSLELDPLNSYAFKNTALVYIAEGKLSEAIAALERAKELKFGKHYGDEVNDLLAKLKR